MKTAEKLIMQADNIKTCGNIIGKAGYGMKLAALFGYKVGYNVAKNPGLEIVKKQIEKRPGATLAAVVGIGIGIFGILGFLLKEK